MTRLDSTLRDIGVSSSIANRVAERIVQSYNEPQRHYHTLTHIQHMLNNLDRFQEHFNNKTVIVLAIWFHDCVYDPVKGTPWNEEESIRVWEQVVGEAPLELERYRDAVSTLIRCTILHQAPASLPSDLLSSDVVGFLDLDMCILAESYSAYDAYAEGIRKEYAHFPVEVYRTGRIKVLETFLSREKIFMGNWEGYTEKRA